MLQLFPRRRQREVKRSHRQLPVQLLFLVHGLEHRGQQILRWLYQHMILLLFRLEHVLSYSLEYSPLIVIMAAPGVGGSDPQRR
jgi:hypothetical protein